MTSHRARVPVLLDQLAAAQIDLVEWEQPLQRRLSVPLATDGDLFFLIPDEQLPRARQIASSLEYHPESTESLPYAYSSEFSGLGARYNIDDATKESLGHDRFRRLVLLPLSWSTLSFHDLEPAEIRYLGMPEHAYIIWTVPLSVACTAIVRLICAETRTSPLRRRLTVDLANLLLYNFYDTSYEGDYEDVLGDLPPLSESELLEIEIGVKRVKSWEMRDGEEWIRENLIKLVSGTICESQLPWKDDS